MLFTAIEGVIETLDTSGISSGRKQTLRPLIDFIQSKVANQKKIRINFICTHNSRRSHLAQVWTQAMATCFNLPLVYCYSGGMETTALFPMVAKTLERSGFKIETISEGKNPVYSIKYSDNEHPIIGFSKKHDHSFNPQTEFAAVLTCSQADENCPIILGAEKRIAITYQDPIIGDGTLQQEELYQERSIQIATEMKYIFSKIKQ